MVVPSGGSSSNGIEIVIQAQNQASQVIGQIQTGLAAISSSAAGAQINLADMSKALTAGLSAKGIDLASGAVVNLGNRLVDITQLVSVTQAEFSTLFSGATIDTSQIASSFAAIQAAIPQEVQSLFDAAQAALPGEFAAFQQAIASGLGSLSADSITDFIQSPIDRIQAEIDKLSQVSITQPTVNAASANPLAPAPTQQAQSNVPDQLRLVADARTQIQQLQQEIVDLQNTPIRLRNELVQIQLDTTLPADQKDALVASLQAQIAAAEQQLQSPLQQLTSEISTAIASATSRGASGAAVIDPQALIGQFQGLLQGQLGTLLGSQGTAAAQALITGLSTQLNSGLPVVSAIVNGALVNITNQVKAIPESINQSLGAVSTGLGALSGITGPLKLFDGIKEKASEAFGAISKIGEQITFFSSGFSTLQSLVSNGPFELLIGQNLRLNEQLLATKASLVATNTILDQTTGKAIQDPTKAIEALGPAVDAAIAKVRKGSEQLSGVTSSQLIETFQIVAQNSSQVGLSLDQSADTALSLAAAITTLGVPLDQARQEVNSILTAQISSDSVVAKSLGITNEMVNSYKAQGKVFDLLQGKLGAFRASNAIAANSIGGITSNIQEVFENVALAAGKPLLEPITAELNEVYQYLLKNRDAIQETVSTLAQKLFDGVKAGFDALQTVGGSLQGIFAQVPTVLVESLSNFLQILAQSAVNTVTALQPMISVFTTLVGALQPVSGPLLQIAVQAKALQVGIAGLTSGFGVFANLIPGVDTVLKAFLSNNPLELIEKLKGFSQVAPGLSGFNELLDVGTKNLQTLASGQAVSAAAAGQFNTALAATGRELGQFVVRTGLLAAGIFLAFQAVDTFFLKNEALMETLRNIGEGIGATIGAIGSLASSPFFIAIAVATAGAAVAVKGLQVELLKLVATQLGTWAGSAAGALGGVARVLSLLKFGGMATSAANASGALGVISAAAASGTLTFGTLATQIGVVIVELAALLLPVAAVVAAIGLIGAGIQSLRLKDSTEAVEISGQQTDAAFQSALQTAQKLKTAKTEQEERTKNGIKLSAEEYQANQKLQQQADEQKKKLDDQIASLKDAKASAVGDENKASYDAQIASLEKMKSTLASLSQATAIKPKPLQDMGSVFEQLSKKAGDAERAINESSGDPAIFKEKAKELIDITQQQLDQQQISAEEAQKRLGALANNRFLDAETQIKAREAITKANKEGVDEEVANRKAAEQKLEGDIAVGRVSEAEGQKQITELRKQELDLQIAAAEEAHKKRLALLEQEFAVTRATLAATLAEQKSAADLAPEGKDKDAKQAQVAATEKKIADQEAAYQNIRKSQEETFNNERTKLQSDADKLQADSAKQAQEAKLKEVEKAQKAAQDATKSAENDRLIQTQQLLNKGVISEEEAAEAKVKASQSATQGELQAESAKQAALQELIKTAATPKAREELEEKLRDSRLKTQSLTLTSLEEEKKAQEAHVATVKAAIEKQNTIQQIAIEKRINDGTATEAEAADLKADQKVKEIQAEIGLEKEGSAKRLKLELELQQAIRAAREAEKNKQLEKIKIQQNKEQIAIEKQINAGTATEAEAADLRADQKVALLEKELSLEKKNKVKRVELELEIQKAIRAAREAEVAKRLDALKQVQTKEQIEIEKGVNAGTKTEAQAATLRARQKLQQVQTELGIEGITKQRRLELELELQTSLRAVREAEMNERKAQLEQQNLAIQNQIQEQNQKIQQQADLFKIVSDAIENRNRLLKAGADLAKAQADFVQAELNILSQGETSELRKRQLAQTTAAIKLQSLQREQAFARESLALQEEQNRLKLEQEKIQNRIAQGEQQANIAKAQADIEVAKLDPKTNPAQRKALELKLQAEQAKFTSLQQQGGLLDQKGQVDARVAAAERQKQAFEQRSQLRGAQAELARTLPPGQKQRAEAALRQQIAEDLGAKDYGDLRSKGVASAQAETQKQFGSTVVRPSFDGEVFDAQQKFAQLNRNFGAAAVTAAPSTAIAPGTQPLALPQADLSQLGVQFENSGSLFTSGVDKLVSKLDTLAIGGGGGQNINITLNTPQGTQKATVQAGNTTAPSIENIIKYTRQLAGVS